MLNSRGRFKGQKTTQPKFPIQGDFEQKLDWKPHESIR
jgi:hypothetical protein